MSKKNVEEMLFIVSKLIRNLTDEQFEKLLKGRAVFQYIEEETNQTDEFEQIKEKMLREANNVDDVKRILDKYPKKFISLFCHYFGIVIKSNDSKTVLYKKITLHFIDSSAKETAIETNPDNVHELIRIAKTLKEIENIEEAKEYLVNQKPTKEMLVKIAKHLSVYINQRQTKQQIQTRIIDSVVGAKIRSKGIREKE